MKYLDTSVALLALLGQEGAERSAQLIRQARENRELSSSTLLVVEMARAAHRRGFDVTLVDEFVAGVELVDIGEQVVDRACSLTGELKSLDAIHLATALLLDDPRDPVTVFTHDARLGATARARGLEVVDPLE